MLEIKLKKSKQKFSTNYRIFVVKRRLKRHLDNLGTVKLEKDIKHLFLNCNKIEHWLSKGLKVNKHILFYLEILNWIQKNEQKTLT